MKLGALTKQPVTDAGVYVEVPDSEELDLSTLTIYRVGDRPPFRYSRTLTPLQLGADERDGEIERLKASLETRLHLLDESRSACAQLRARIAALESPPKVEGVERPDDAFELCWVSDSAPARIIVYALSLERETKRLQALAENVVVATPINVHIKPPPADPDAEPVPYCGVIVRGGDPFRWATHADLMGAVAKPGSLTNWERLSLGNTDRLALHGRIALARAAKAKGGA